MKRIKIVWKKPNPLFELWLEEWMDEAAANGSELRHHFAKALRSLKKYPLPLESGRDCIILQHFGTKLCLMLDKKLEQHRKQSKESACTRETNVCTSSDCNESRILFREAITELYQETARCNEEREQLSQHKQKCTTQGTVKEPTAKPETKTVTRKKSDKNIKKNVEKSQANKVHDKATSQKSQKRTDAPSETPESIILKPLMFDIILLVDVQETSGGKTTLQHDATVMKLNECGVMFEVRHLKVGDFTWIAKCKHSNKELVLPYIAERKRMDDLSASITDGRFHEQKFRLKQSGIENLIYIVEKYDKNSRMAIPISSLMQASINSLIQDGFMVQYTNSHEDTMEYLARTTAMLNQIYSGKTLSDCRKENLVPMDILSTTMQLMKFEEFNKAASKSKNFTVREMFVRFLLQLKGISVEKAVAIVEQYPTPSVFLEALNKSDKPEQLLANIRCGPQKRNLGAVMSKTICQLYLQKELP